MKCPQCGRPSSMGLSIPRAEGYVMEHHRACRLGHSFHTYEVMGSLTRTIARHAEKSVTRMKLRAQLFERNEGIKDRLLARQKHEVIASEFGVSPEMVGTLAARWRIKSVGRRIKEAAQARKTTNLKAA